jgi:hypothetical protein
MLKAMILGCAICAGTSGTVFWVAFSGNGAAHSTSSVDMPSIQELHANAHLDNLPVQSFEAH